MLVAAIALAVLVGAGVTIGVVLLSRSRTTPVANPPASSAARTTAAGASSAPADPAAGAVLVDAARFGPDGARFSTPSRNIACSMSDGPTGETRCDVAQHTWQLPPKPPDCTLDYGGGAVLTGTGRGELTCAGDTVADPSLAVLPYGQAVVYGGVVCVSRESGVRCTNPATGHGFRVARASYELF